MNKKITVKKCIAEVISNYNIPIDKKMVTEINDYINDYVENMDIESAYNPDGSQNRDLIDSILSKPALRKEMEAFILLLVDEAEKEKREKKQNQTAIEDFASADDTIQS
jgi:phage pi2 protein 07